MGIRVSPAMASIVDSSGSESGGRKLFLDF